MTDLQALTYLRQVIEALRIPHYSCEDCYYDCPAYDDGDHDDDWEPGECDCRAKYHNAAIDKALELTKEDR